MDTFLVTGGNELHGSISVSGAKNVALKTLVAACLTSEEIVIENIPIITDFSLMVDIMKVLGAEVELSDHTLSVRVPKLTEHAIPLDKAAMVRTSLMFIAPLLIRNKEALIPNPGGCRLGARPIDRIVDGLKQMNAEIVYNSQDGYFHAKTTGLRGTEYTFVKNSHTGTETLLLAAVLAEGQTVLKNAAEEPEIDDLITLLNAMGAKVKRTSKREITISGVKKLHGSRIRISPDRNEIVTFAVSAIVTRGNVLIHDIDQVNLDSFLFTLKKAGAVFRKEKNGWRFSGEKLLHSADIVTDIFPGFMTDWQAPWAVLMTQAKGISIIHERVFEDKLGYAYELKKMGAHIDFFNPRVSDPESFYNFNMSDNKPEYFHAIRIHGATPLHDAILQMRDLRAGAAVVLAALAASGTSTVFGVDKLDRGYEKFDERLRSLGAKIVRM